MKEELISIIVPVYNIEKYIARCLQSLLNQTFSNIEIIVVDDGSTDDSGKIIDRFAQQDSRILAIHKENGGVSSARMEGIKKATGDYIGFVDGDDFAEPEMFQHLLKNAVKYQADISHCGYKMVFPDGHSDFYYNTGRFVKHDKISGLRELLEGSCIDPGLWNKLYRKTLIQDFLQKNDMDTSIKINEDLLMNYYLFKEANVSVYEDVCLYQYVLRKNSAATALINESKLKDPIRVLRILLKENENIIELRHIIERRLVYQLINIAVIPYGNQKDLIQPFRKEIRRELREKLKAILSQNHYGTRLKMQAVWAAVLPTSYYFTHLIYAKAKGLDKKYTIE